MLQTKLSSDSSNEMMALLKLSEYQSNIRMNTESKYGNSKDLRKNGNPYIRNCKFV